MGGCACGAGGSFCCAPGFLVTLALGLSLAASGVCDFLELDDDNQLTLPRFPGGQGLRAIGFWCFENNAGDTFSYGQTIEGRWDNSFEVARSLGTTANVLGFIVWVIYLFAACAPFPPKLYVALGFLGYVTCMFEGFKLWMFRSTFFCDADNRGCDTDTGAKCCISAVVFWFVAACTTCGHAKERMMAKQARRDKGSVAKQEAAAAAATAAAAEEAPPATD